MPDVFTVPPEIYHVVGVTPTLISRPAVLRAGIVKTVRGTVGTTTSFVQEGAPRNATRLMVLMADLGIWRVKVGNWIDRTFDDGDVSIVNDTLTITGHGIKTGQGPFRFSPAAFGQVPAGLTPYRATNGLTFTPGAILDDVVEVNGVYYQWAVDPTVGTPDGSVGTPYLVDVGVDDATSLANLVLAINATGTGGVTYSVEIVAAHATVEATGSDATTVSLQANSGGVAGNLYTLSVTGTDGVAADAALFSGGLDAVDYYAVAVDDDTVGFVTSKANAYLAAPTLADLTDVGVGTITLTGLHNASIAPSASVPDGSGAFKLAEGQSIVIGGAEEVTVFGNSAAAVLSHFWE